MTPKPIPQGCLLPQHILFPKILQMGKLSTTEGRKHAQYHLALWNQNQTRTQISWAFLLYHILTWAKRSSSLLLLPILGLGTKNTIFKELSTNSCAGDITWGADILYLQNESFPRSLYCYSHSGLVFCGLWKFISHSPCHSTHKTPPDSPVNLCPCLRG